MSLLDIAKDVTGDENIEILEENIMPIYECDCSKEKIEKGLITLGKDELQDIINTQVNIETVCHFCNEKYVFAKEELEKILENAN
jgi:molecular chaperone Hsp33